MQVVEAKDLNIKFTELSSGKYLIDSKEVIDVVYSSTRQKVRFSDTIQRIDETKIKIKYVYGESEISVSEYDDNIIKLLSNKDENDKWNSLEDEFEYRKFIQRWQPVYKTIQTFSDPLIVSETFEIVFDTGNKFIESIFLNDSNTSNLNIYKYQRLSARIDIVHTVMKELGMEFKNDIGYQQTKDSKIYGNSTHSGIRYLTAFGGYVFNDSIEVPNIYQNTLEACHNLYKADYDMIKKIISDKYKVHFGEFDIKKLDGSDLISDVNNCSRLLSKISYNKKSYNEYKFLTTALYELKDKLLKGFNV